LRKGLRKRLALLVLEVTLLLCRPRDPLGRDDEPEAVVAC
jgi:hypothetical protein